MCEQGDIALTKRVCLNNPLGLTSKHVAVDLLMLLRDVLHVNLLMLADQGSLCCGFLHLYLFCSFLHKFHYRI